VTDVEHRPRGAERREATRQELLRLGMERFPLKGYSATTIEDIVSGTGISRPTWYFHFGNKEDYFLEILRMRAEARGEWWLVARDPALQTLEDLIRGAFRRFAETTSASREWPLLIVDYWQAAKLREDHREALAELYAEQVETIAKFVDEARARGMVGSTADRRALAAAIFGLVEGIDVHSAVYRPTALDPVPYAAALLRASP